MGEMQLHSLGKKLEKVHCKLGNLGQNVSKVFRSKNK